MANRSYLTQNGVGEVDLCGNAYLVYFRGATDGKEVFSATQILEVVSIFESHVLDGTSNIIKWDTLDWEVDNLENGSVSFYIRNSDYSSLSDVNWEGPYLNSEIDLSSYTKRYLQFRIIMRLDTKSFISMPPKINKATVSLRSFNNAEEFYLNVLDLDFNPKKAILTYNAITDENTIVEFALAGEDTVDTSRYQVVTENEVNDLVELTDLMQQIKVRMRAIGRSDDSYSVDEFAVMLIGDGKKNLN